MELYLVVALLVVLGNVSGKHVYPPECPEVTIQQELNLEKFQGKWYDWMLPKESLFQCGVHSSKVATAEANIISFTSNVLLSNGSDVIESGIYRKELTTRPKGVTLTTNDDSWFHYVDGYVLETDYETYSVILTCELWKGVRIEEIWIASRSKDFLPDIGKKALDVLKRNNLNIEMVDVTKVCADYYKQY